MKFLTNLILFALLLSFSSLFASQCRVCYLPTGQCKIVSGSCANDWGDLCRYCTCTDLKRNISISTVNAKTTASTAVCYVSPSGLAYFEFNGQTTVIASDEFISDLKGGKITGDWKKYENQPSSKKVIDEICREYNIKAVSKEVSQPLSK
jgi:hypothetical protein